MIAERVFHLSRQQLAAAIELAGLSRQANSFLPDLPTVAQPLVILRETSLLSSDGRHLRPEVINALRLAASPGRVISIDFKTKGDAEWMRGQIIQAGKDGSFVILMSATRGYDLLIAGTAKEAAATALEWLGLAELPDSSGGAQMILRLPAYAALFAAADALEAVRLRARVARRAERKPVLTSTLLESALQKGLAAEQGAVAAAGRVCPVDLGNAAGQMSQGLEALQECGLLEPISRGWGFSEIGEHVIGSLADLEQTVGLTLASEDRKAMARVSLFRGPDTIWIAAWSEISASGATNRWSRGGRVAAEVEIIRLLDLGDKSAQAQPASEQAAEVRCANPACGAPIKPGKKFCTKCGRPVVGDAEPAVVERRCPKCHRPAAPERKFCQGCGTKLPAAGLM